MGERSTYFGSSGFSWFFSLSLSSFFFYLSLSSPSIVFSHSLPSSGERKETISFKSNRQRVLSTGGDGSSSSSCAFNEVNCPYGVRGLIQAEKIFTELEAMRHSRETGHSVSKKSLTKFFKSIASPTNLSVVGGWPGLFHSYFLNYNEVITPQVLDEYERLSTSLLSNANFSTTTTLPNNTSLPTERELDSTSQAAQILSEKLPSLSSFLTYIRTHRVDPVNGIVGLLPPPNLMEKYCPELFKQHHREPHSRTATATRLPTPLAGGSTSNLLGGSTRLPPTTSSASSASSTPAHLLSRQKIPNNNREWTRKVREWAEIADPQR
jgi:hypothetical protein